MIRSLFFLLLLIGTWTNTGYSQSIKQLQGDLKAAKYDTTKCRVLLQLMEVESDKLINEKYAFDILKITQIQLKKTLPKAELKIYKNYESEAYLKIGYLTKYNGDIKKALEYYHRALKLKEELDDKTSIAVLYNNIGVIHRQQKDPQTALKYFQKSYGIFKILKDKQGMAYALNSIGALNVELGKYKEGVANHLQSLTLSKMIGEHSMVAMNYINIGYSYEKQEKLDQAIQYYQKSLRISDSINNKLSIAYAHNFIGSAYLKQKKYKQAKIHLEISLKLAQELGFPENIRGAAERLYKTYEGTGEYKKAFQTYRLFIKMKDSIYNQEVKTDILKKDLSYTFEKKAATDSIKAAEEKKVVAAQFKKEQTQRYALYIGLGLVLTFSGFLYNRFRVINRQKKIIELKEKQTQEQNALIFQQKKIIEERHKEITDSINYAERIQRSFLASAETLDKFLPEYFIFFKPKDIVSGDFYWAGELKNGKFALVTADSTGHGVPGAIMSLLNITSLEKAIDFHNEPSEILNHARNTIIDRLKKDGSTDGGKDGMDCSICVYDFNELNVKIAAANNPVWIVRNHNIIEIKPDKMPVGKFDNQSILFTQSEFQLVKNDMVFTITDGFQDQFGGELGKKFKTKNLRDLLVSISVLPLQEQAEKLEEVFKNWTGNLEQIDDVCIIGVRV